MEAVVYGAAHYLVMVLDAVALLMLAAGAARALYAIGRGLLHAQLTDTRVRAIFIDFARWLVAGLSFQLGSDIAATTVAPDWEELGWLVAVAAMRTALTYTIDRDLERARTEQTAPRERRDAQALTD